MKNKFLKSIEIVLWIGCKSNLNIKYKLNQILEGIKNFNKYFILVG